MTLARIDQGHFISACRHGVVHLMWGRVTVRLGRDEFRRLASLLEQASGSSPPMTMSSGGLRVTLRQDEDSELQLFSLTLLLSPGEFRDLAKAAQEAVNRLDEILTSGAWDEPEEQEAPPDPLQQLRQVTFSKN
jgi:hypothetical protein